MPTLNLPAEADYYDRRKIDEKTGKIICPTSVYSDLDAMTDLICTITHCNNAEDCEDEELIGYGTVNLPSFASVEEIIDNFQYVQDVNNINRRAGRRIYHEILHFSNDEIRSENITPEDLMNIGYLCAKVYFDMGFQALYAVHWNRKEGYHIHFAVNTISYMSGAKWKYTYDSLDSREDYFDLIIDNYLEHGRYNGMTSDQMFWKK